MKDFRKLFADSIVKTTHLLKKSVMIPVKYDEEGNLEESYAYTPFLRGVMEFDDYNYAVHNPYILVEDPNHADVDKDDPLKKEEKAAARKEEEEKVKPSDGLSETHLSAKNINTSITEEYAHDLVTVHPS